jgi:GNAT superfamily N-acetyltransferase
MERNGMPWVIRDVVYDLNKAVARRWQGLDPLLPEPSDLPEGCMPPLLSMGPNGRSSGLGICRHQYVAADTLAQTWGAATKFLLSARVREADAGPALDDLLTQWREHIGALPDAAADDTAAVVNWPSRDITGILALLRHGLQPMAVIAARPAGRPTPPSETTEITETTETTEITETPAAPGLVIRQAGPDDLDRVTELEMGVVRYDAHFGGSVPRPATEDLIRAETQAALAKRPGWIWLAEQDRQAAGLISVEPPEAAAWIANMTRPGATAYLHTGFVRPGRRGGGVGAALVRHVHGELDARGINTTLLHYSQVNPLSAPFWHRMGYRPLWTTWEARPASALR